VQKRIIDVTELASVVDAFLADYPAGAVVGLSGDLGAGKTTFVRRCILSIAERQGVTIPRVLSPSFVLHQSYSFLVPQVEHFDLYRLENVSEQSLLEMGYYEAMENCLERQGYLFVEWPEHVADEASLRLTVTMNVEIEEKGRVFRWK